MQVFKLRNRRGSIFVLIGSLPCRLVFTIIVGFSLCHKLFLEYLQSLVDTTVITVSHDTQFMEQICTDVIHYEKREGWIHRKLIHYRGAMSDFVKKQPQAKHYFELATSDDLVFKFPEPGRLEG